ncbi:MAG TPA: heavy metal sensor histidine kinase [Rhodocyclaceae bacterium]|nr:heavy metal sensor histidine kinase [Rhodocyclaceae bacterium]
MTTRAPSLTARLAGLFALTSSVLLAALGALIYVASDRHFVEQDAHDLHGRAQIVSNLIARYAPARLPEALDAVLVSHHQLAVVLLDAQGTVLYARAPEIFAAARATLQPAGDAPGGHAQHPAAVATLRLDGEAWRSISLDHAGDGPVRRIWLAIGIDHHLEFLSSLLRWLVLGGGLAALLSGGLGVWVARRGLAPLQKISANATLISAHRLSERLDPSHLPRELLPLVGELNAMLARLDDAFRRLTDFSSDIAHELRTPISNLVTQTEVALTRARSADEYREVLASNLEEFGRLARMIADMLFLARADHGLVVPQRTTVDLAEQADALLSFYDALAEERGVRLERRGAARVSGDPLMLRRALSNLLSNALRHAAPASTVFIDLSSGPAGAQIVVSNHGAGISAEHLPRLFDRFYRGDFARHRDGGAGDEGTGLGLGIVKSIVEAHGGQIGVSSRDGETRFVITLPSGAA